MKCKPIARLFLFLAIAASGQEKTFYPQLALPRTSRPPVLDGQINQEEWSEMAAITEFRDYRNRLLIPHDLQPVWWLGYDNQNLYLAQKMPLYPSGTVKASVKQGDRGSIAQDVNSILYHDHAEIQFCTFPERPMAMKNYFYKIISLVKGNGKKVAVTIYRRRTPGVPEAALIALFNEDDQAVEASVKILEKELFSQPPATASDPENGQSLRLEDGVISGVKI
ncbi:MAG: hypothetical protein NC911_07530 [Candidatus Omnitrophica bacterium]|nr:hypothetical protein [Candidatus Omnitrophota bacterium]MCM8769499.1 hypothetical protein [Candidatus Omnitrophota bacterium]